MNKIYNILGVLSAHLVKEVVTPSQELEICQLEDIISCQFFKLDFSALGEQSLQLDPIHNQTLYLSSSNVESSHSFLYENKGDTMLLTYHNYYGGSVHGHLNTGNSTFTIEFIQHGGIHVFKQVQQLEENKNHGRLMFDSVQTKTCSADCRSMSSFDLSDVYVRVYYTSEFASITSDVNGFIQEIIENINVEYRNERSPIRLKAFCSEQANISENQTAEEALEQFKSWRGSVFQLHGGADLSVLFAKSFLPSKQRHKIIFIF